MICVLPIHTNTEENFYWDIKKLDFSKKNYTKELQNNSFIN